MGFFPRLFSLSLRGGKKKKLKEQERQAQAQREAQSLRPTQSALAGRTTLTEHELLRMSSRNCSVYGEIDYLSPNSNAPPLSHPVNEIARSRASSRASSHLDRTASYVVRVHGPPTRTYSRTTSVASSMAPPPLPSTSTRRHRPATPPTSCSSPSTESATPATPPSTTSAGFPLSPEDARQLARLRSDASVADLVTLYTGATALDGAFRNSPTKPRTPGLTRTHTRRSEDLDAYGRGEGRPQAKRKSTDLRSLLHASPAKSDDADDSGDVLAWADDVINQTMFRADAGQDASDTLPRPSFSSEDSNDQELYFSSTIAEVGSAASHANTNVYPSPSDYGGKQQLQRGGSVRASDVFSFLLHKDDAGDEDAGKLDMSFVLVGDKSVVGSLRRTRSAGTAAVLSGAASNNANLYRSSTTAVDTPNQTAPLRMSASRPARPISASARPTPAPSSTRPLPVSSKRPVPVTTDDNPFWTGSSARVDFGVDAKPLPPAQPEPVKRRRSQSGGRALEAAQAARPPANTYYHASAARSTPALALQLPAARGRRAVGGPREMRPPSRSPMRAPAPPSPPVDTDEDDEAPPAVPEKVSPTSAKVLPAPPLSRRDSRAQQDSPGWHADRQCGVAWARAGEVLAAQNGTGNGRRALQPSPWSATDLGYEEVKENLPLHHTPSAKPWRGGLEAPSPAPSRASSSELSPIAQRIMQDVRQKRTSRSGMPNAWR
ncbi:hypothetical protein AURDEDRAFT_186667 [Auricularia subglabra TFB-10046 SS5]|nr:hypothetical protein AURDEDRAFT_186667 [Auricularia subglabra TFB-10046 SS5]